MAYIEVKTYPTAKNFLASEHFIPVTYTAAATLAVDEGDRKVIKAGTIYPANTSAAVGIVYADVDVTGMTNGLVSVIVEGRIFSNRLPVAPAEAAISAMKGITFLTAPDATM